MQASRYTRQESQSTPTNKFAKVKFSIHPLNKTAMNRFIFFLTTTVCLICCNLPAYSTVQQQQDNYGMEYDEEMSITRRGFDLYMEMLKAGESGQNILEYGPTVLQLHKEMLAYIDTCRNIDKIVDCKRITVMTIVFISKYSDLKNEAQGNYFYNTILPSYNKVIDRWHIEEADDMVMLSLKTYIAGVTLFFHKTDLSSSYAVIEFPNDALYPNPEALVFTSKYGVMKAEAMTAPEDDIIGPNDDGVTLLLDEHPLLMIVPMKQILPKMLKHKKLLLHYTGTGNESEPPSIGMSQLRQQLNDAQKKYRFVIP